MEYGAIDLHKRESQVRIVSEDGEIIDRRIATTRDRLTAVFWGWARMRILLEASTESEWVAQHLETLGHDVIVADPNFTPMYSQRSRRIKTDRRDVAALADACQPVHPTQPEEVEVVSGGDRRDSRCGVVRADGEGQLRRRLREFATHYHGERNHQGLAN